MKKFGKVALSGTLALGLAVGGVVAGPETVSAHEQKQIHVRDFASKIGANVSWNGDTRTVTLTTDKNTLVLRIGSETARINGKRILVNPVPQLQSGKTMVSENLLNYAFSIGETASTHDITEAEVLKFQQSWGEGIVHIGKVYSAGGDYKAAASQHINKFYGYNEGTVLFKPTLALKDRHRGSFEEALSYFVGGDISEDKGFAIAPWTNVRWENEGVIIEGNKAVSMGVYYFTPANGGEPVEVEYSFAYTKNDDGELKIVLHDSHLPYNPPAPVITEKEVLATQQSWGEGIVNIGKVFSNGGDYKAAASQHINKFYGYDMGEVLFKPTLAREVRHRDTFEEALSYFVGGDISEDKGFAITPWKDVRWENKGVIIKGNKAVSMGVYYFTPANGGEPVEVEYSFAYTKNDDGELKIVLHDSHLPYTP